MESELLKRGKWLIFWNPLSGKSAEIGSVREILSSEETAWVELDHDCDVKSVIRGSVDRGCRLVVAAGGDGTVNAIVNGLMTVESGQRPKLAIIPLGTANDFASTLKLIDDPVELIRAMRAGQFRPVDVIRAEDDHGSQYYANVAAGGNCVRVSEALTDEVKLRWGALSYMRGAVEVLPDMQTYKLSIECDGETINDFDSWAVLVANGRTNAGQIVVAPLASPSDGLLDLILIRDGNVIDMIEIVANNVMGNYLVCDQVEFRQAKRVSIRSEPAMRFTLDGEIIENEPWVFEVIPGAIEMLVGAEYLVQQNKIEIENQADQTRRRENQP